MLNLVNLDERTRHRNFHVGPVLFPLGLLHLHG